MIIDATFWVAISFIIFVLGLIYIKVPQKINDVLNKMIGEIKKEISVSENLKDETENLLNDSHLKLENSKKESKILIEEAKKESEKMIIEINDKFFQSSENTKKITEQKIRQLKESAIKEIKDTSIKIAIDSVKKIITTSVDKSKLDNLFSKNLEETKAALKKINS